MKKIIISSTIALLVSSNIAGYQNIAFAGFGLPSIGNILSGGSSQEKNTATINIKDRKSVV